MRNELRYYKPPFLSLIREEVFTSASELEGKRQAIRYRIEDFR